MMPSTLLPARTGSASRPRKKPQARVPPNHTSPPPGIVPAHFFTAPKGNARLYITAKGLYVAWLNGVRVGDMVLAPGSFTGDKHLGAQTYDVTPLLHEGENELLITLGDGWHRSTSGVDGGRNLFGDTLGVLFQLEVDGKAVCVSDTDMRATQRGPIRQNDMQQGEVYDARLEGELTGWHGVRTDKNDLPLVGIHKFFVLYWKFYTQRNTTLRV